jgi:hypothetical protein
VRRLSGGGRVVAGFPFAAAEEVSKGHAHPRGERWASLGGSFGGTKRVVQASEGIAVFLGMGLFLS